MSLDEEMAGALATFFTESRELLQDMEDGLLGLEKNDDQAETINAIFRAAHTIKGSAGLFGMNHIVRFTHVLESVLDLLRNGEIPVNSELISALFPCRDHISALIDAVAAGHSEENEQQRGIGDRLMARLQVFLQQADIISDNDVATPVETAGNWVTGPLDETQSSGPRVLDAGNWHLSLRFGSECFKNGMDPLSFIHYLSKMGEITHLETVIDFLPGLADADAESCFLGFEINIKTEADKAALDNIFEFVREDSVIVIFPLPGKFDELMNTIKSLPMDEERIGEILVKSGTITQRELQEGLTLQDVGHDPAERQTPIGQILVGEKMLPVPLLNAALEKQQQGKDFRAQEKQSIRVDADRLDRLIDLVGELVIAGAGANLQSSRFKDAALSESTSEVMRLVEEVRDSSLQLRMVAIGNTFNRFQRVVRDVSLELGKDISLVITGGETEVDKSVIEKIGDPLMHLVRNAMDHGIEAASVRIAKGKPARGVLSLNAYHESGIIVIEVSDDGGGLNRERILAKAIEKGLIQSGDILSDQEVYALIFEPGFSTADEVSNLSGRGVGMDVVKRNVVGLRGTIDIQSQPGSGSKIRIRLPLTLAIIDGFLVEVGESSFVIPLVHVIECVEMPRKNISVPEHTGADFMDLRGEVLPFIRLRKLFDVAGPKVRRENVVVVGCNGVKAGLVVDRLLGEFQTVIKPLGALFNHVQGIGGSTILGSGEVALILGVPALIQHYGHYSNEQLYKKGQLA